MRSAVFLIVAILSCGCGKTTDKETFDDQRLLDEAASNLANAKAVAKSKNPALRLAAWQREWVKDAEYSQPMPSIFVTQRNEFEYRWEFSDRDFILTVSERPNVSNESRDLLYLFVTELESEWRIGPRFIYQDDAMAGAEACVALQQKIIDDAIRVEETTSGAVYPDAYPESKAKRIAMMKGPNRVLAMNLSYNIFRKSGKELSGTKTNGDVFSFIATAKFNIDGTVSAKLSAVGK